MTDDQIAAAFNTFSAAFRAAHGDLAFSPMDVFRAGIQAARYAAPSAQEPVARLQRMEDTHTVHTLYRFTRLSSSTGRELPMGCCCMHRSQRRSHCRAMAKRFTRSHSQRRASD